MDLDLSISPASRRFVNSSLTNLWCLRGKSYGLEATGVAPGSVGNTISSKWVTLMSIEFLDMISENYSKTSFSCCLYSFESSVSNNMILGLG